MMVSKDMATTTPFAATKNLWYGKNKQGEDNWKKNNIFSGECVKMKSGRVLGVGIEGTYLKEGE